MRRLEHAFADSQRETALVAYLTAGYPSLDETVDLVDAACAAGADVIELGAPFSDPLGDGPVIQATTQQALRAGVTVAATLDLVAKVRATGNDVPIMLMGYCNPFLRYGLPKLFADAASAGADGFIVPDLPATESTDWLVEAERHNLGQVFFAAPGSSPERLRRTARQSRGFLYCLADNGVTGVRDRLADGLDAYLARVRAAATTPVAVGFGISRPEHVAALRGKVDGVIVGSALLKRIGAATTAQQRIAETTALISELKEACR
ncbi:tryptophan synthase subunit alpha [Micromonospora lutea]|uniref:Tryptophan synthase alpha chain n=1 Tax=Micromonospora lutea TaxID=419825 RepID=A0ABQ4J1K2_9ACTN|nr:tryptophan synthase subunit alpha [Micromonospora lutea]GIJ24019.1 tryptophan synthase alpha chain [Micromonospora lutea]